INKLKQTYILCAYAKIRVDQDAAREQGRIGDRRRVMTEEVVERCRRMLENGATRQQVADVTGVDVKTIYKYLPAT
ncbi:helix-turn-helix domain-containing protein, partial [Klebsiella pneumoniae]|uniref:helix-turn-helix domain-containing protein n=1 Tax=Klebsiella pneumoniae TaxID=573 RepID=UPI00211C0052